MGIGPVKCSIGGHLLVIDNVRYIPEFNHWDPKTNGYTFSSYWKAPTRLISD
jgi:hypothetical protein